MSDERIDLSVLDPTTDPARLDREVGAILARVSPALAARRARPASLWEQLGAFQRPVLALAAALAVTSGVVLFRVPAHTERASRGARAAETKAVAARATTTESRTLMESVGVPSSMARWVDRGESPSAAALLDL